MKRLVYFWAEWCQPCHKLSPIVAELVDELDVELLKVDADTLDDMVLRYAITSVPTLVLEVDGDPVGMMVGAKSKTAVREFITESR